MLGTQVANNRVLPRGSERVDESIGVGSWAITVQLAPPQAPPTQAIEFWDGTPALAPITGENCWGAFPLCVTSPTHTGVRRLGPGIQDGFAAVTSGQ